MCVVLRSEYAVGTAWGRPVRASAGRLVRAISTARRTHIDDDWRHCDNACDRKRNKMTDRPSEVTSHHGQGLYLQGQTNHLRGKATVLELMLFYIVYYNIVNCLLYVLRKLIKCFFLIFCLVLLYWLQFSVIGLSWVFVPKRKQRNQYWYTQFEFELFTSYHSSFCHHNTSSLSVTARQQDWQLQGLLQGQGRGKDQRHENCP